MYFFLKKLGCISVATLELCCTRTAVRTRTPHVRRAHFLKICGARVRTAVRTALIQRRKPSSYTLPFVVLYQPLCAGGYPGLQRTSRKAEKRVSPSSDRRHASVAAAGGVQQVPQRAKVSGVLPDIFSSFTISTAVHTAVRTPCAVRTFSEFAAHACACSIALECAPLCFSRVSTIAICFLFFLNPSPPLPPPRPSLYNKKKK